MGKKLVVLAVYFVIAAWIGVFKNLTTQFGVFVDCFNFLVDNLIVIDFYVDHLGAKFRMALTQPEEGAIVTTS